MRLSKLTFFTASEHSVGNGITNIILKGLPRMVQEISSYIVIVYAFSTNSSYGQGCKVLRTPIHVVKGE